MCNATELCLLHLDVSLHKNDGSPILPGSGGAVIAGQNLVVVSGGVGSFAVQLAVFYGGIVTAVTSSRNTDWVSAMGPIRPSSEALTHAAIYDALRLMKDA